MNPLKSLLFRHFRASALLCAFLLFSSSLACAQPDSAPPPSSLRLTVMAAVLFSMENNRALKVQRLEPAISRRNEEEAMAPFDTVLNSTLNSSWQRAPQPAGNYSTEESQQLTLGAARFFPSGTTAELGVTANRTASPESDTTRLGLTITQALLQGRGNAVNLATLQQTRLSSSSSDFELRGFAENLVAQVEAACWDYLLAERRVAIFEHSLRLAQDQLAEVKERIAVGRLAEIEQAAAEAEAAMRQEDLINARSSRDTSRLQLLRLLNPPGPGSFEHEIALLERPVLPEAEPDAIPERVALALKSRPEMNQARLQLERNDLELLKTKNGLLPRLDFFLTLGKTAYASSFGSSLDLSDKASDLQAGVTLRFPWENSAARAAEHRATLSREQAFEAIANLSQLVELDVRTAVIEVQRLRQQAASTQVSLRLQQEKLRAETEKFRLGKSTTFLVAQAQRDLVQSETSAESAVMDCLKAQVNLYRLEGSLLDRRGITLAAQE